MCKRLNKQIINEFYVYMYLDVDNVPFYIGKGKNDRYLINTHTHKQGSNKFLKSKIRKIDVVNVKVHFLHKNLTEEEAFHWERYWIKYIGRRDLGEGTLCNLTDGGEGSGHSVSVETKQQISKALKGHKVSRETRQKMRTAWKNRGGHSEETKRKISEANKGKFKPMTEEHKRKISATLKGRKPSPEAIEKMSRSHKGKSSFWKGKKLSKEHKRKIGEAHKDKKLSKEHCRKISKANTGKKHTEETKRKISKQKNIKHSKNI